MESLAGSGRLLILVVNLFFGPAFAASILRTGFYKSSCPAAEEVVRQTVINYHHEDVGIAAGLIRLYFHDCFVRGCDASILLDMTPSGDPVEKCSPGNGGLNGEHVIDVAKFKLENLCPGTVSCADILAFAARDAAVVFGVPYYSVPSGRRDGCASLSTEVGQNLPAPFFDVEQQTLAFKKKGFTQEEMVVLAGAHSIGGAHCSSFDYRLYNYSTGLPQDPAMAADYARFLRLMCPRTSSMAEGVFEDLPNRKVCFGVESAVRLDGSSYYWGLLKGVGLLDSDQALVRDCRTRRMVREMAKHPGRWAQKFTEAMMKLGNLDVITGEEGEVRKSCRFVNMRRR